MLNILKDQQEYLKLLHSFKRLKSSNKNSTNYVKKQSILTRIIQYLIQHHTYSDPDPLITNILPHHSVASSSANNSSSSSFFSSQDCSTIFVPSPFKPPSQPSALIHSQHPFPPNSLPHESSTLHSYTASDTTHTTNDYSVATRRDIQQLVYLDTQKKNKLLHPAMLLTPLPHHYSQSSTASFHESCTSAKTTPHTIPITKI